MSEKKNLLAKNRNNNAVQLHNNGLNSGSIIEQSLGNLNEQQARNLMTKAAEEGLRLEVKNREQNMDYILGKKAAEDHIDTFSMLEKQGKLTRQSVRSDIKTGAGNMHIESKSGATCFVASVAYGDPNHPDVIFLRSFRDNTLSHSKIGQKFIKWYWTNGPRISKIVEKSFIFRKTAKLIISRIIKLLKYYRYN